MQPRGTPCPQCGSPEKFAQQRIRLGDVVEIYIRCTTCSWQSTLHKGPIKVVEIELDIAKIRGKIRAGQDLHQVLQAREERLARMKVQLGVCAICR